MKKERKTKNKERRKTTEAMLGLNRPVAERGRAPTDKKKQNENNKNNTQTTNKTRKKEEGRKKKEERKKNEERRTKNEERPQRQCVWLNRAVAERGLAPTERKSKIKITKTTHKQQTKPERRKQEERRKKKERRTKNKERRKTTEAMCVAKPRCGRAWPGPD